MSEKLNEYELNEAFYSPSIYHENLLEGVAHSYKKQQIENHARYCKTRMCLSICSAAYTDFSIINNEEKR